MKDFDQKVAVVTGASSGIGRAVAASLAAEGMRVVLASQNEERLDAAVASLRTDGATVIGVPTDVGRETDLFALAAATEREFGPASVLVNNAGVFTPGYAWEIETSDWQWVMDVNLWGVIHAVRAFMPSMLELGDGHVVNVSSAGGLMGAVVHSPYCTSKHALVGFSRSLKADLALKGADIGVTLVCPGAVATDITNQFATTGPGGVARGPVEMAPEVQQAWDALFDYTDAGIPPADVGAMVVEAIRSDAFWLLPNAEMFLPVFEADLAAMAEGR